MNKISYEQWQQMPQDEKDSTPEEMLPEISPEKLENSLTRGVCKRMDGVIGWETTQTVPNGSNTRWFPEFRQKDVMGQMIWYRFDPICGLYSMNLSETEPTMEEEPIGSYGIAAMIRERGVNAAAVSGSMKSSERKEMLAKFQKGEIKAMCACDLLNEGWDCPETEVLFMARPTMSKVLYTQQLGRGMRLAEGKEFLMVFDFVDNASQYNMPYSLHRLFKLKEYRPGQMVLGKKQERAADASLYAQGEKPDALVDYPISATDLEAVDLFNWQEEAAGMISQMEFIRRVDVQSETVERYIREGRIIPDIIVPMSEHKQLKYFTEDTLARTAQENGWKLINDSNRKELFMEMVEQMDMSYSYKPVLLKAIFANADSKGRVNIDDISAYFRSFYEGRRSAGLVVEKANSIFARGGYTDKEAQRNILSNPFKRFEDMQMLRHTKTLGIIEVEPTVWKNLTDAEIQRILTVCEEKLESYYSRFDSGKEA